MNNVIYNELKACKVAKLPPFDESTEKLIIEIGGREQLDLIENKYYVLELDDSLLDHSNSIIENNWNSGKYPKTKYLLATLRNTVGKMVLVDACGFVKETSCTNNDVYNNLWLPKNRFKVIGELDE